MATDPVELLIEYQSCAPWHDPALWVEYFSRVEDTLHAKVSHLDYNEGTRRVKPGVVHKAAGFSASYQEFLTGSRWLLGQVDSLRASFTVRNHRADPKLCVGENAWHNILAWRTPLRIAPLFPEPAISLFECGMALRPFYSFCDTSDVYRNRCQMPVGPQWELNGVFWLTCFNSNYVNFFGRDKIEGLKSVELSFHSDNGVTLRLGDTPFLVPDGLRAAVEERLGKHTFHEPETSRSKKLGQYVLTFEQLCPHSVTRSTQAAVNEPVATSSKPRAPRPAKIRKRRAPIASAPSAEQADRTAFAKYEIGTIPLIATTGAKAPTELKRLRGQFAKTSSYPVILGNRECCEQIASFIKPNTDPAQILADSEKIDPKKWFRQRAEDSPGQLDEDELSDREVETDVDKTEGPKWPAEEEVFIGLFEIEASWQVFAHLNFGGWNECPNAAEHCAIQRHWNSEYGTEVISLAYDTIYLQAPKRPKTKPAAIRLARQQYAYCNDIVEQGTQSIGGLAGTLLKSDKWFFWWD